MAPARLKPFEAIGYRPEELGIRCFLSFIEVHGIGTQEEQLVT